MKKTEIAREVVGKVVFDKGLKDPKALRVAIFHAYPFETRQGYPYRAWLKVIKDKIGGMRPRKPDPRQMPLFESDNDP